MRSALQLAVTALLFLNIDALRVSSSGRCGSRSLNRFTCKNSAFGNCCSKHGYCGSSSAYCGTGCQSRFGDCGSSNPPVPTSSVTPARTSTVSSAPVASSVSSAPGASSVSSTPTASSVSSAPTASSVSSAPTASSVSSAPAASSVSSAPAASSSVITNAGVSTDGSCGGSKGYSCVDSGFGNCCSEYGWCGSTSVYCGTSCNAAFGNCDAVSSSIQSSSSSTPTSSTSFIQVSSTLIETLSSFVTSTSISSAAPTSTQTVSTDAQCGPSHGGTTCLGSGFGDCCSEYSWCGSTSVFCGTGCQNGFGECDDTSSPSSTVSSPPSSTSTPPSPGLICGVNGFANNADYYASSFNLIDAADPSPCIALCLLEPECQSYIFNVDFQNCAYLKFSVAEGDFIATDETEQFFWDRACAEVDTPPVPAIATSSSSSIIPTFSSVVV